MRVAWLVVAALTVACNSDADGDGLDAAAEKALGTDPKLADTDGDGIDDAKEADTSTDPLVADTDKDGMSDGDEVLYGFDPLDEKSDGYKGGWPMQEVAVKDGVEANGKPGSDVGIGKRFPRWRFTDNFGDEVDLYDYSAQGKKIIIDVSAQWCPPCQAMAAFMDGDDEVMGDAAFTQSLMPLRDGVESGDLLWVTVLPEQNNGSAATVKTAKQWHQAYPTKEIAVLADTAGPGGSGPKSAEDYVVRVTGAWPTFMLLNENMTVVEMAVGLDFSTITPKL